MRHLSAYALLGAPLAMAALPVYVLAPKLYGDELGMSLALLGAVLFGARLVDTLQDPWLGRLVDRWQQRGWTWLLGLGTLGLAAGFIALFAPPALNEAGLAGWLAVSLVLAYTAHSLVNVCYLTWGARISDDPLQRSRITGWREACGLAGVLLASVLPLLLAHQLPAGLARAVFSALFVLLLLAGVAALLWRAPLPNVVAREAEFDWWLPWRNAAFSRLALVFLINGLALSIAATLALFFIADVIRLPQWGGAFLGLYFVGGALCLPLWVWLGNRIGKPAAWLLSMGLGCLAFVWAALLGAGDGWQYACVCLLSGLALGADLALPPALLADVIPPQQRGATGSYFGYWSLLAKLSLALAAGLALPLLALLDYQPGGSSGLAALSWVYALLPCGLKCLAAALLLASRRQLQIREEA
ncbi:MAG: MFS transporter [Burkholderiales bacterium]|jgi:GPH family glycoside/pentoside/hexuronide:cation symporter